MKKNLQNVVDSLPSMLNNIADWVKDNFDENAQEVLKNSSGSIGIVLKLVGQPLLNKYFSKLSAKKLESYGFNTYIKAAYSQASKSISAIEEELKSNLTSEEIIGVFNDITLASIENVKKENIVIIFQPKYHPAVVHVKNNYVEMLQRLNASNILITEFKKDFNDKIREEVEREFGEDYKKHLKEISSFITESNESDLLWDTINISKIGFDESEDLKYETTYGFWKEVSRFNFEESIEGVDSEDESKLKPVSELIEQYFNVCPQNNIEKILFLIADFGKGKSVFLKHYASQLANNYLLEREGYFPIYFNLRNFQKYQENTRLGVLSDYLLTKYGINIDSEYFRVKKYIFLIDSLDESGELNKRSIERVINSIKQIQNIDKEKFRTNRIIITSRPISEGLEDQLRNHAPFSRRNPQKREIEYFISLYGFKKDQFNDWLYYTLKQAGRKTTTNEVGFVTKIYKSISSGKKFDLYTELLHNETLTSSELRRPIFAYMIYQLIVNNIDFLRVGKIGVYLSFLNLLTKDAKHIKDPNYKVSLPEEFEFRNLLHATSALWMFERHKGNQGFLKKSDLCRVLDGFDNRETDTEVLERYKKQGVVEIEFLSHSYFGENNNTLHFQHQSFAEILLAEYYLKIFIKYALDEDTILDEARAKLILGIPTEQTINFLKELLILLKETSDESDSIEIIEKRKLLFPFLASIAIKKNNTLFSNDIYYEWYKKCKIDDYQSDYPIELLSKWYFTKEKVNKIINLAKSILNSKSNYILAKADTKSSLFSDELLLLQHEKISDLTHDIDRWLALLVGNELYNDFTTNKEPKLFNYDFQINPQYLFELIRIFELSTSSKAYDFDWRNGLFKGINMINSKTRMRLYSVMNNFDFSFSHLKEIDFSGCLFGNTNFDNCFFENINFSHSFFWNPQFNNIKAIIECKFNNIVVSNILIPFFFDTEFEKINQVGGAFIPQYSRKDKTEVMNSLLSLLLPFIEYYNNSFEGDASKLLPKFIFESAADEKEFKIALAAKKKILPPTNKA